LAAWAIPSFSIEPTAWRMTGASRASATPRGQALLSDRPSQERQAEQVARQDAHRMLAP